MSRSVAVFDLDGTITVGDSHARLLLGLLRDPAVARRTRVEIVAGSLAYLTGSLPNAWTKEVVARAWRGRERAGLEASMERFCQAHILPDLSRSVLQRLREHQGRGDRVLLLSASLTLMVDPVARALGVVERRAVDLAFDGQDRVQPALDGPCYHGPAKARWLEAWASAQGADLSDAHGYGNSHGDRHFLAMVGHPVAVGPDPLLRLHARRRGWEILAHDGRVTP